MYEQEQEYEEGFVEPSRARRIRDRDRVKARRVNKHTRIVTAIRPRERNVRVRWWEQEEVA
jgi:hypothetical protein